MIESEVFVCALILSQIITLRPPQGSLSTILISEESTFWYQNSDPTIRLTHIKAALITEQHIISLWLVSPAV